ncbi:hypothetical protein D3C85_427330 [compost metagenome]
MSLLQEGIGKGLITISDDNKTIKYIHQYKTRNLTNPEEKVQVETFLSPFKSFSISKSDLRAARTMN